jgi:hypothetical protein
MHQSFAKVALTDAKKELPTENKQNQPGSPIIALYFCIGTCHTLPTQEETCHENQIITVMRDINDGCTDYELRVAQAHADS